MAAMSTMGFSRAAVTVVPLDCMIRESGLSLGLPQRWKRVLCNSFSGLQAGNARRRFSGLDAHSGTKLGDMHMGMEPSGKVKEVEIQEDSSGFFEKAFLTAAIVLMPLVDVEVLTLMVGVPHTHFIHGALAGTVGTTLYAPFNKNFLKASASGGEFGLLEGRSLALVHPIVMGGLFAYTVYAGYLGWQWRRVRTIQTDITELKKQVKQVPVAAGEKSTPAPPPSPVEAQISSLTEERKELLKGGFKDRHFNAGSILLGLGVFESVGGAVNTWFRTGKLFPGPHLFAGAGITICWAVAAALVPAMQKGNETARNLHIGLNLINILLFVWQIPTGLEIVLKVFEFTTWP